MQTEFSCCFRKELLEWKSQGTEGDLKEEVSHYQKQIHTHPQKDKKNGTLSAFSHPLIPLLVAATRNAVLSPSQSITKWSKKGLSLALRGNHITRDITSKGQGQSGQWLYDPGTQVLGCLMYMTESSAWGTMTTARKGEECLVQSPEEMKVWRAEERGPGESGREKCSEKMEQKLCTHF